MTFLAVICVALKCFFEKRGAKIGKDFRGKLKEAIFLAGVQNIASLFSNVWVFFGACSKHYKIGFGPLGG